MWVAVRQNPEGGCATRLSGRVPRSSSSRVRSPRDAIRRRPPLLQVHRLDRVEILPRPREARAGFGEAIEHEVREVVAVEACVEAVDAADALGRADLGVLDDAATAARRRSVRPTAPMPVPTPGPALGGPRALRRPAAHARSRRTTPGRRRSGPALDVRCPALGAPGLRVPVAGSATRASVNPFIGLIPSGPSSERLALRKPSAKTWLRRPATFRRGSCESRPPSARLFDGAPCRRPTA